MESQGAGVVSVRFTCCHLEGRALGKGDIGQICFANGDQEQVNHKAGSSPETLGPVALLSLCPQ